MRLARPSLLRRVPWSWVVPLAVATPVAFELRWKAGGTVFLGDSGYLARAGETLLSGRWAHTYDSAGVQAGPLELAFYGGSARLCELVGVGFAALLSPVVVLGVVALLLLVLQLVLPPTPLRPVAQALLAVAALLSTAPSIALSSGHVAEAVIPLLWVLAAREARAGRGWRAGIILGAAANVEVWGVLGSAVIVLAPNARVLARAALAAVAVGVIPFVPFALAGSLRMFSYHWSVSGGSLVSLVLPVGSAVPWSYRLGQGGLALAAGACAARATRGSAQSLWIVPLVVVAVRLLLDPVLYGYYLVEWIVLVLVAAGALGARAASSFARPVRPAQASAASSSIG